MNPPGRLPHGLFEQNNQDRKVYSKFPAAGIYTTHKRTKHESYKNASLPDGGDALHLYYICMPE